MNRLPVSRIGDVQSLTPQRLYAGASTSPELWARLLADAVESGRPVRVLIDEETVPTLELMATVQAHAADAGLQASWVVNPPLSVDLTVTPVAPDSSTGTHGSAPAAAGEDGAPTPVTSPAGVGSISLNDLEVEPS